jgi:hypothetical protein
MISSFSRGIFARVASVVSIRDQILKLLFDLGGVDADGVIVRPGTSRTIWVRGALSLRVLGPKDPGPAD